jgi:hypothetical protein
MRTHQLFHGNSTKVAKSESNHEVIISRKIKLRDFYTLTFDLQKVLRPWKLRKDWETISYLKKLKRHDSQMGHLTLNWRLSEYLVNFAEGLKAIWRYCIGDNVLILMVISWLYGERSLYEIHIQVLVWLISWCRPPLFFSPVLELKPRLSCMTGKCSTTEFYIQPWAPILIVSGESILLNLQLFCKFDVISK